MVDDRLLIEIVGAVLLVILAVWNRSRGKATSEIKKNFGDASKTEAEMYKNIVERQLVELKVNEIIDARIAIVEEKLKNMLWNSEKEHYEVKLEIQARLIESIKEKTEAIQENEILKNELEAIHEQYGQQEVKIQSQQKEIEKQNREIDKQNKEIEKLRKEVEKLKTHNNEKNEKTER